MIEGGSGGKRKTRDIRGPFKPYTSLKVPNHYAEVQPYACGSDRHGYGSLLSFDVEPVASKILASDVSY